MSMKRRLLVVASLVLFGALSLLSAPASAQEEAPTPAAPTFKVFATRQGLVGHRTANGHIIQPRDRFVALPSWTALSSRGGNEFQVRVTYRDRSVVLPVWDVGPWNTNDDYWSPNRRYSGLPQGMPMAQAAVQQGYNGGRDEFGRRIQHPNGIDIADGAFWDDLGMRDNDWVEVTFLWMGADPGPGASASALIGGAEEIEIEPGAVVVDDGAPEYDSEASVRWFSHACGLNGNHAWAYGTNDPNLSKNSAIWSPILSEAGFYEVLAYIPVCGPVATSAAQYQISHGGATFDVAVDQQAAAGSWVSLGTYYADDGPFSVTLSDVTGDDGRAVRFDALQFVPRTDTAPPDARVDSIEALPDGSFLARWSGEDDVSGIASFDVQVRALPDGEWVDWQYGVAHTEYTFVPPDAHSYAFRARARDWAGHEQPWRDVEDVILTVPQ